MPSELVQQNTFLQSLFNLLPQNNPFTLLIQRLYYIWTDNKTELLKIYVTYQQKNSKNYKENFQTVIKLEINNSNKNKQLTLENNLVCDQDFQNFRNLIKEQLNSETHFLTKVKILIEAFDLCLQKFKPNFNTQLISNHIDMFMELHLLLIYFKDDVIHFEPSKFENLRKIVALKLNYLDTLTNIKDLLLLVLSTKLNNKDKIFQYYFRKTLYYINYNKDINEIDEITLENYGDKANIRKITTQIKKFSEEQRLELKNIIDYIPKILNNFSGNDYEKLLDFINRIKQIVDKTTINIVQKTMNPETTELAKDLQPITQEQQNLEQQRNSDRNTLITSIIQNYNNQKKFTENIKEYLKKFNNFSDFIFLIQTLNKKSETNHILEKLQTIKLDNIVSEFITKYQTEQDNIHKIKKEIAGFIEKNTNKNIKKIIENIENLIANSYSLDDCLRKPELQDYLLQILNIDKNLENYEISNWIIKRFYQPNEFKTLDSENQTAKKIRTILEDICRNKNKENIENLLALKNYFLEIDQAEKQIPQTPLGTNRIVSELTENLEKLNQLPQTGQIYQLGDKAFSLYVSNNKNYQNLFNYCLILQDDLKIKNVQEILEENLKNGQILSSQDSGTGLKFINTTNGINIVELRQSNDSIRIFAYIFKINNQKIAIVKKIENNPDRTHDQKNYSHLNNQQEIEKHRDLAELFCQQIRAKYRKKST